MDAFSRLNEKVQRWVWRQGWEELRPIQSNAIIDIIKADRDVILGAPTAGGKTEAAYLPILSNLLDNTPEKGYAVLNLSPLKALINDQATRLSDMTTSMGFEVTAWHGDIAASTKSSSLTNPSGIILITPESLESMFVNRPHLLAEAFANLRYVVIDELHAFMGSERGVQLQSLLARLEHEIGRKVPRIALSATFADYSQATDFLRPARGTYPVAIPDSGGLRHDTKVLIKELVPDGEIEYNEAVALDIYRNLRGSNNLVFANSRKEAESLALKLSDFCTEQNVPNEFVLHHGSLAKSEREKVESDLKNGLHPTTAICTSTLELGVDIGKVRSIAQLVTANSVSGLRQRLGRSGRRGEPSILRIYSCDEQRDDYKFHLRTALVQNIAVIQLLARSEYESTDLNVPHYSTLIQQTLSLTAQYGSFYPADAWRMLCRDGAFTNVSPDDYILLLRGLGEKGILTSTSSGQIVVAEAGERLIKGRDFYTAFVTLKDLNVVDKSTGQVVGNVQYKPYVGEYILLGARRWLVETVDDRTGTVGVNPAQTTGKMMFEGYGQEIDGLITREMKNIYESNAIYPYLDTSTGAPDALQKARDWYKAMDLHNKPLVRVGDQKMLFTWGGMKLNRTLALMRKADGYTMPLYDAYAVADISEDYLHRLKEGKYDLMTLAKEVPRHRKVTEKFDNLLPDSLLDRKFAAASLTDLRG